MGHTLGYGVRPNGEVCEKCPDGEVPTQFPDAYTVAFMYEGSNYAPWAWMHSIQKTGYCYACPAGRYHDTSADDCKSCPVGKYSAGAKAYCDNCPAHHTTSNTGSTSSSACFDTGGVAQVPTMGPPKLIRL